ncbi:MAG: DUF2723 domain-containing protein [Flavobacteriaceae bacterium]|jgi:hypothetical protein|nr:DUF2723 domain-containing protein [Flavobacteriaceae bacterium]
MNSGYKKLNNIIGWGIFAIAAITYLLTIEPNFSFWDCGEYISSAVKLEISHSPGAITFQILGAVWALFAFGNGHHYSIVINAMSAIMSAFTIIFLFWTITHLVRRILFPKIDPSEYTLYQKAVIFLSGAIGALTFTFTDTFWFSAVEGEVYASASCFTALLLWLICKWEDNADSSRANKWLILISLIIGLSVGVHLMVLLVVPTMGYIYYAKKYDFTWKNFIIASVIIGAVFIFVFKIIFVVTMGFFGASEIFFVNDLQMPFNTGSIFAFIVIIAVFYYGLTYTAKHKHTIANTVILSVLFMLIGFSSWMVVPIRANANPPINLNDPDNAIGMKDYYNRVQYGDWPTFYGANYTAYLDPNGIIGTTDNGPIYEKNETTGRFEITGKRLSYKFDPKQESFLPRMYNNLPSSMENYGLMEGYPEFTMNPEYAGNPQAEKVFKELQHKKSSGEISIDDYQAALQNDLINVKKPTLAQNFNFMMTYQMGYMFVRYLLWNFAGRQNDIQGNYQDAKGNWVSGIKTIDAMHLGNQDKIPSAYVNKATNHYFFLPLLLGLIGFFFQLNRDSERFWALLVLFLLTSAGIIFYTNVRAFEPRERDYALVTAFYTFGIWIGLGVTAVMQGLKKLKQETAGLAVGAVLLGIPLLVAFQNWDDHDRSRRYTAYDFSYSYLNGLDKNSPILFVYGDNDTYPLWALQETEEFRSDAKVVNYTLLGTSWYIDQVLRKTYQAPKLPSSLVHAEYRDGTNDQIFVLENDFWKNIFTNVSADSIPQEYNEFRKFAEQDSMSAKEAIAFIRNKQAQTVIKDIYSRVTGTDYSSRDLSFLPLKKIYIPVNKENALKYGIVKPEDAPLMVNNLKVTITRGSLDKATLAMLDMFANYNWDRSIYFSSGGTYSPVNLFYTQNYLEYQGMVSKLVPIYTPDDRSGNQGRTNPLTLYNLIMNYRFGNFKDPKAYFDETCRSNILNYRMACGRAAIALAKAGDKKQANDVLALISREIPLSMYPATPSFNSIISAYLYIGEEQEGLKLAEDYKKQILNELDYYLSLSPNDQKFVVNDMGTLSSYYSLVVSNMVDTYQNMNQQDKALSYITKSFAPLDERLKNFEMLGKNGASKQHIAMQNLMTSYGQMFQILHPIDSVYEQEKLEEVSKKIMKLE